MEDLEIKTLCQRGDFDLAVTWTLQRYGAQIFGYMSFKEGKQLAEDLYSRFQERLWQSLSRFRWECSLKNWCYKIAINTIKNPLSVKSVVEEPLPSTLSKLQQLATEAQLSSYIYYQQLEEKRDSLLAVLNDEERAILYLRVSSGMSWNDIAKLRMEASPQTNEKTIAQEAANCRKIFQRLTEKLHQQAVVEGLTR